MKISSQKQQFVSIWIWSSLVFLGMWFQHQNMQLTAKSAYNVCWGGTWWIQFKLNWTISKGKEGHYSDLNFTVIVTWQLNRGRSWSCNPWILEIGFNWSAAQTEKTVWLRESSKGVCLELLFGVNIYSVLTNTWIYIPWSFVPAPVIL